MKCRTKSKGTMPEAQEVVREKRRGGEGDRDKEEDEEHEEHEKDEDEEDDEEGEPLNQPSHVPLPRSTE